MKMWINPKTNFAVITLASLVINAGTFATAQDQSGLYTDPGTGYVYRQVKRVVQQPRFETKMEKEEQTVFKPQTVRETIPETKTTYEPRTTHEWQAYLQGRWNLFRQPTVAYRQVAKTTWEPRTQVIPRTSTRTNWVAEKRTVEVPHRIVRMENKETVQYELVGRVAPTRPNPNVASSAVAARLQPVPSTTPVVPVNPGNRVFPTYGAAAGTAVAANQNFLPSVPRIASTSVGKMTSDPPRRSLSQGGMRPTELYPEAPSVYGQPLPSTGTTGVARLPGLNFLR